MGGGVAPPSAPAEFRCEFCQTSGTFRPRMADKRPMNCPLLETVRAVAAQAQASAVAVALHDFATDAHFSWQASRTFHAASTIKLALLLALFRAAETGRLQLTDRLHVRNRFRSQADGAPFFLQADRDGDPDLYKLVGRTAPLLALAETMIGRSSNLATNLLFDCLEAPFIAGTLAAAGLDGLRCLRGVEDEAAFAKGMNNQVTAAALLDWFRRVHEAGIVSPASRDRMFDILLAQRFNAMIPAGIPDAARARVAHKTGEISTVCHDAGLVFLPGRAPYGLVILTEYPGAGPAAARNRVVASISSAAYEWVQALPS